MITLVFADDYAVTRAGIRALLGAAPDIQILGEADNGEDVKELVLQLRPQILLLDLKMPGPSAAQIEKWVRTHCPETCTLVLTAHDHDAYLTAMLDAGAVGYIGKNESAERLIGAIRRAAEGEILFDFDQINRAQEWRKAAGDKWASLSERERQILVQLAQGLDRAAISASLQIVPKTVEFHITHILKKLGVKSYMEAVLWMDRYFPDEQG